MINNTVSDYTVTTTLCQECNGHKYLAFHSRRELFDYLLRSMTTRRDAMAMARQRPLARKRASVRS